MKFILSADIVIFMETTDMLSDIGITAGKLPESKAQHPIPLFLRMYLPELYIYLHNKTKGIEERIFTYENGKQVWW